MDYNPNPYDKIIEQVWLGNKKGAVDRDFMLRNNIKLVVNCAKELDAPLFYKDLQIAYIWLPMYDVNDRESNEILSNNIDLILDTIHNYRKNGMNVFIHCHAGMSRSATVLAAYLIRYYDHHYKLAIFYIQTKRPITFRPRPNFEQFLSQFK
jgi:protein-tyrosine phosphatase